eukprot:TRINITY_DN5180_c0_g1_i1.p1 TRINITY_DN5180_c0_g1~~TRINITY_DN5180_c0_g1_i1.p1  ORF type:complete len:978 (+),score=184.78 TRINITY_DN5180_c0_g1_i1:113-3046(+)
MDLEPDSPGPGGLKRSPRSSMAKDQGSPGTPIPAALAAAAMQRSQLVGGDSTAQMLMSLFHEASDDDGRVSLSSYLGICSHSHALGSKFDHQRAIEIFRNAAGSLEEKLDHKKFKKTFEAMSWFLNCAKEGAPKPETETEEAAGGAPGQMARRNSRLMIAEQGMKLAALQDLVKEVAGLDAHFTRRTVPEIRMQMYDAEVLNAAYEYNSALREIFQHYASEPSSYMFARPEEKTIVNARSMMRLAKACGLIPKCVVAGEFHDIATILGKIYGHRMEKYFQDEKMFARGEDANLLQAAKTSPDREPRYTFPDLIELFIAAALHMPPRLHSADTEARSQRIHEVLGGMIGLPRENDENAMDFDAEEYLIQASGQELVGTQLHVGLRSEALANIDMASIYTSLSQELPDLPTKKEPQVAQPKIIHLSQLRQQPPTAEEQIAKFRREGVPAKAKAVTTKKKGKKKSKGGGAEKKKNTFFLEGPVIFDKVQFLAKRPERIYPEIPLQWESTRLTKQFQALDDHIYHKSEEAKSMNAPATGWVLRMQLIDEPLKAPPCPQSEEVSTLIESALTSRRLRQYDAAIMLLIRARKLWSALKAGRHVPAAWSDVQREVETPSPWEKRTPASSSRRPSFGPLGIVPTPPPGPPGQRYKRPSGSQTARSSREEGQKAVIAGTPYVSSISQPSTGNLARDPEGDRPLTARERRQEFDAKRASQSGPLPATPRQYERGRDPASRLTTHTGALAEEQFERRYSAKRDFAIAAGAGEDDLDALPPDAGLFFFYELASLHSALNEDDLASKLLWRARAFADRMEQNSPDAAFVWCGLGRVAFHSGNYEIAARLYMKTRVIREKSLGGDTVDTATSYNNLACCFAALERPSEALAFTELAAEILKELAGEDHPRSQAAMRNLAKARTAPKNLTPEVPNLYSLAVRDHIKALKGGKGGKKKKKGGSSKRGSSKGSKKSGGSKKSKSSKGSKKKGKK